MQQSVEVATLEAKRPAGSWVDVFHGGCSYVHNPMQHAGHSQHIVEVH